MLLRHVFRTYFYVRQTGHRAFAVGVGKIYKHRIESNMVNVEPGPMVVTLRLDECQQQDGGCWPCRSTESETHSWAARGSRGQQAVESSCRVQPSRSSDSSGPRAKHMTELNTAQLAEKPTVCLCCSSDHRRVQTPLYTDLHGHMDNAWTGDNRRVTMAMTIRRANTHHATCPRCAEAVDTRSQHGKWHAESCGGFPVSAKTADVYSVTRQQCVQPRKVMDLGKLRHLQTRYQSLQ